MSAIRPIILFCTILLVHQKSIPKEFR